MNFADVNTVADLVMENDKVSTPEETAIRALMQLDAGTHLRLAKVIVHSLRDYHREIALSMTDDTPFAWIVDATRLDEVLTILDKVELG